MAIGDLKLADHMIIHTTDSLHSDGTKLIFVDILVIERFIDRTLQV